ELKSCWAPDRNLSSDTSLTGRCALAIIASLARLVVFPLPVGPTTAATAPCDPSTPSLGWTTTRLSSSARRKFSTRAGSDFKDFQRFCAPSASGPAYKKDDSGALEGFRRAA